jgi:hypothetical protein
MRQSAGFIRQLARRLGALRCREAGMATAEYAIGTLAAVAFAVLLFKIATSPQMVSEMASLFSGAFRAVNPGALVGLR